MAQPVTFFVHFDHPTTEEERAEVAQHEQKWRTRLGPGASAFALQRVEPPADVSGVGEDLASQERLFAARLREAELRTLVQLDAQLRGGAPAGSALQYAGRVHLGPAQTQALITLVEALQELQTRLPASTVRVHDGQSLRYVRVAELDVEQLRHQLGR